MCDGFSGEEGANSWFRNLFGFDEMGYRETRGQFKVRDGTMSCEANGAEFFVGPFEVLSLGELRSRLEHSLSGADHDALGPLTFQHIVGDAKELHAKRCNAHSVFQVASQFNCLEMRDSSLTPQDGITQYALDRTQGPVCALSCPAATVYRNYFAIDGDGQAGSGQIDCLSGVGELLDNTGQQYWKMQNGYCLPAEGGIKNVSDALGDSEMAAACRARLQVGIHWDTDVKSRSHRVCQVFCSALPVGYSKVDVADWAVFAQVVLEGAYEATLAAAAVLASERRARVKVFLTAIGGGAFRNQTKWITAAIRRALRVHAKSPLDVRLVHHGYVKTGFKELEPIQRSLTTSCFDWSCLWAWRTPSI